MNFNLNIVLVEPEIPSNTGNIARTCSVVGASLHLVEPLGFDIGESAVKRAGLDYWDSLNLKVYTSFHAVKEENPGGNFFFFTTKAPQVYSDARFEGNCFLVFGKETMGLPERLLKENLGRCVRIPMLPDKRSLNLSNAAAVAAFEALRQNGFPGLLEKSAYTCSDSFIRRFGDALQ